jgi:uncharacterized protein (DUF4415 family)
MKKPKEKDIILGDDEIPEEVHFNYNNARPNRFAEQYKETSPTAIRLDADIAELFTTSEEVNKVLRAIIEAMPEFSRQKTYVIAER